MLQLSCTTPSSVKPLSIPLAYKTIATPGDFSTLAQCASVADVQVTDGRADKAIGRRFIEDNAATVAPVTASSDVAAWVRTGAIEVLKQSGVSFGKSGAPILRISIEQIRSNENVVHRSGYDARITMSAKLARGGNSCWSGQTDGEAENYGYSGSVENYQETLNHALDRAILRLTTIAEFRRALCTCGH